MLPAYENLEAQAKASILLVPYSNIKAGSVTSGTYAQVRQSPLSLSN
jgi:hypothetical protein